MIAFDIETGPISTEQLKAMFQPPNPPPMPGEFDPSAVKLGNLKDQTKIAEKVEAAKAAHEAAVANHAADAIRAAESAWQEFCDQAPRSALTGRVLAIGYRSERATVISHLESQSFASDETVLIEQFWGFYRKAKADCRSLVCHNIAGFDIPFLIRRSWILDIDVPDGIFDSNWRYLDRCFVDTMQRWQVGNYRDKFCGLDELGKALKLGGKVKGIDGGDFHRLYFGTAEERAKALEYLIRDVDLTYMVAERLGVV